TCASVDVRRARGRRRGRSGERRRVASRIGLLDSGETSRTEDNVADFNTELLQKIAKELSPFRNEMNAFHEETRAEFAGLHQELAKQADRDEMLNGFTRIRQEMADAFSGVHSRIDTLENEATLDVSAVRFELDVL